MIKTNQKSFKIILLLIAVMLIALPSAVRAEDSDDESDSQESSQDSRNRGEERRKEKLEELTKNRQEEKNEILERRCENKKRIIDNKIKMFNASEKFHKVKYSRIYDRISSLIERLDAEEIDTTKLKSDLHVLRGKIDVLKADYDALMSKLEALKSLDCTDTETTKAAADEIRDLLEELKGDSTDIREYFINTIKPDLKELRKELIAKKETTENSETTESEGN